MLNNTVAFSGFKVGECARFSPAQSPPPTSTSACRKHTNCCWFSKSCKSSCVFTCKCVNQSALFLSCLSPVCAQVIDIYCIIYILYMANNVFSLTNMSVDLKSDFSYIVLSLSFILQFCLFILKWFYDVSVIIQTETPIHMRTFLDTICATE